MLGGWGGDTKLSYTICQNSLNYIIKWCILLLHCNKVGKKSYFLDSTRLKYKPVLLILRDLVTLQILIQWFSRSGVGLETINNGLLTDVSADGWRPYLEQQRCKLHTSTSVCGPWASSISMTWQLVRNSSYWAHLRTVWKALIFTSTAVKFWCTLIYENQRYMHWKACWWQNVRWFSPDNEI